MNELNLQEMHGFKTLKDLLDVVFIPIVIIVLGVLLPRMFERRKRRNFRSLIKRELEEMKPDPEKQSYGKNWPQHLGKRFIHEEIIKKPSENRDFILALPPKLTYSLAQLWVNYEKAYKSSDRTSLGKYGASWCDQLWEICNFFDCWICRKFRRQVYKPWERLVLAYHPDLKNEGRLPK
jgi:hypothetical protein